MINVMLDPLPEEWNWYKVNTSFRIGIQVFLVQYDKELNEYEKSDALIYLLFDEREHPDGDELRQCVEWFLNGWFHDKPGSAKDNRSDVADGSASAWTTVSKLSSGEKHSSIFAKVSQMFKNVRYLYKMLGTTDISKIGNGTCTGAISSLNSGLANKYFLKVLAKDWSGFVGTLFPQFNVQNDNVVDIYADKTDGTYPAVRVARADADYDGNRISDTYLKKADVKNNVSGLSNTITNYNDQTPVAQYFTVPDDGYYLVTGLVTFASNPNGFREVFITNTSANYVMGRVRVPAISGGVTTLQVTSGGTFEPGQTGTLSTYQNSGSNLNVHAWVSMVKIAPKL